MRIPATEILKSIPEFVGIRLNEQPKFTIVEKSKGVEVRSYVPIRLASTKVSSQSEDFRSVAFERLAKYIFGANAKSQKIPMTTPVFQERTGDGWTMSFALPAEFLRHSAPPPEEQGIELTLAPARLVAVSRYSGTNTDEKMAAAEKALTKWLAGHPSYVAVSPVWWAQYDAPFVIPFFKQNEAMVQVHPSH